MEVAKSKEEWWRLVRADLAKWNRENGPDDRMSLTDWIGEVGPKFHGWIAFRDEYGDWDISLSGMVDFDEDGEDEDEDDY
jgi:hypothetical protein